MPQRHKCKRTSTLFLRITDTSGKRRYCPPVTNKNGMPRAEMAQVNGVPERHPEAVFHLRYRAFDGTRTWKAVGHEPDVAMTAKANLDHQLQAEDLGKAAPPAPKKKPEPEVDPTWKPLQATAERWLASVKARRSARTESVYRKTVEFFIEHCGKPHLDEVTREDVTSWLLKLKEQGNAERTIYNYAGYMRTFFRWAGFPDLIRGNDDMPGYTEKQVSAYSTKDLRAMMAVATNSELFLLEFLVATGLREQEAMYAYFDDIDFHTGRLLVREKKEFEFRVKDKEERSIPLPTKLCQELRERRDVHPRQRLILPTSNGNPDGHILLKIKRLHLRAGLNCGHCVNKAGKRCDRYPVCRKAELHKTRKSFATLLSHAGTPPQTISKYLGHSDLQTTLRYLEAAELSQEQRAQVDKTFAFLEAG